VNTVFQNYALFPHLDIFENVAFGLRRRKSKEVDTKVREMLDLVELDSQARKKPAQLSGGQQQRVALARALINSPEVLLLDEPLGALDLKLRRSMQIEIKRIQTEVGLTFVHVTHDQEEAMTMADTIAVMNAGVIEQMGAPAELYDNPQTTFVANFLGQSNLIEGTVRGREGDVVKVDMQGTVASIPADRAHVSGTDGELGWVGIRPEKVLIAEVGESLDAPGSSIPGGVVSDVSFVGVSTQYLVRMPWGQEIQVFEQNTGRRRLFRQGEQVDISWRPEYSFLLDHDQDATAGVDKEDAE
jgi:spermidine/putrescine transport system ATP-binding protein